MESLSPFNAGDQLGFKEHIIYKYANIPLQTRKLWNRYMSPLIKRVSAIEKVDLQLRAKHFRSSSLYQDLKFQMEIFDSLNTRFRRD